MTMPTPNGGNGAVLSPSSLYQFQVSDTQPANPQPNGVWIPSSQYVESIDPTNRLFGVNQKYRVPYYYQPHSYAPATTDNLNAFAGGLINRLNLAPFYWPTSSLIDTLTAEITVAGSAASLVRFGIYPMDYPTGLPGTLVVDMGTLDATIVGVATLTPAQFNLSRGWYWLAWVWQGGTAGPTIRARSPIANSLLPGPTSTASLTTQYQTFYAPSSSVSGALPTSNIEPNSVVSNSCLFPSIALHAIA